MNSSDQKNQQGFRPHGAWFPNGSCDLTLVAPLEVRKVFVLLAGGEVGDGGVCSTF